MSRKARQLGRQQHRAQRYEFRVFTEGAVTEVQYLKNLERKHRHAVVVSIEEFHGGPLQLVENAVEARRDDLALQERGRGRARDEYWCVFDTDEHPNLEQAIQIAGRGGISVGVSNPCSADSWPAAALGQRVH